MIYALYWKETKERFNSNTNPLLFATKKVANEYVKRQKSFGLSSQLVAKPFTGRTVYSVVDKKTGVVWLSTLEKEIAEESVFKSRNGVMGVATHKVKVTRPKEIYGLVTTVDEKILCVFSTKKVAEEEIDKNYHRIIKIK